MIHLKYPIKPPGMMIVTGSEIGEVQRPTVQCAHCGIHWKYKPGEGKKDRGICFLCMKPTCGSIKCNECTPYKR